MTFVGLNTIQSVMIKHKRHLCYLYDHKNNLIWCSEDEPDPEKVFQELSLQVSECTGQYCIVEVKGDAPGKGGNRKATEARQFVYHVRLNNGTNPNNGNAMNSGMMPLVVELLKQQSDLKVEIARKENEMLLKEINRKLEDYKEREKESPIGEFARVCMDEFRAGKSLEKAVKTARKETAPLADETKPKNAKAEKLAATLNKLKTVDPDVLDNLETMADYAVKHPTVYAAFIEQLKTSKEATE